MSTYVVAFAILVVPVIGYWAWTTHLSPNAKERRAKAMSAATELRESVLSRKFLLEITDGGLPSRTYAMDWRIGKSQLATLVSFDDGTTSIYLSSGAGRIGAGTLPSVQPVAAEFRATFQSLESYFQPVSVWPPPEPGNFTFYIIDRDLARATVELTGSELRSIKHTLHALAAVGQKLFTAVRTAKEEKPK